MIEEVGTTIDDDDRDIVVVNGVSEVCIAEVVTTELLVVWTRDVEVVNTVLVGWIVVICVEVIAEVELVLKIEVVSWLEVVICADEDDRIVEVEVTTAVDDCIVDVLLVTVELVGWTEVDIEAVLTEVASIELVG